MEYRLYFLDRTDHIRGVIPFECDGDRQAKVFAVARAHGKAIELWNRARLVMRNYTKVAETGHDKNLVLPLQ